MNDISSHPNTIFHGAVEWWNEQRGFVQIEKPPFVEYAEAVLADDAEWQRRLKLQKARERAGL